MTFLDGQLEKQPLFERILDALMSMNRGFVYAAASIFSICLLTTPVIFYISFAYFTAREAPWWFDPLMNTWFLLLFLSGVVLGILGLAKLIGSREG